MKSRYDLSNKRTLLFRVWKSDRWELGIRLLLRCYRRIRRKPKQLESPLHRSIAHTMH